VRIEGNGAVDKMPKLLRQLANHLDDAVKHGGPYYGDFLIYLGTDKIEWHIEENEVGTNNLQVRNAAAR
jgi:hypothetical protein